jgi:hypothetical protein
VIEWLFLNGVDAETGAFAIGIEHHGSVFHLAYEAKTAIPFLHPTLTWAQIANNSPLAIAVSLPLPQLRMPPLASNSAHLPTPPSCSARTVFYRMFRDVIYRVFRGVLPCESTEPASLIGPLYGSIGFGSPRVRTYKPPI